MKKSSVVQLIIFISIIIIFIYTYIKDDLNKIKIVNVDEKNLEENIKSENLEYQSDIQEKNMDVTTDIEYVSEDNKGNIFKITSKSSTTNLENADIINLKEVKSEIKLKNGNVIIITSDTATYNKSNNNTKFKGNITVVNEANLLKSDNLDLYSSENQLYVYNNITYSNEQMNLIADKIEINLLNGLTKISMYKDTKKIKVKLTK